MPAFAAKKWLILVLGSAFFLAAILVSVFHSWEGAHRQRIFSVGIVNLNPGLLPVVAGFKAGMEQRGYKEKRSIVYHEYSDLPDIGAVENAVRELLARRVDLILSLTTPATARVKELVAGTGTPVVFAPVLFPVESGLVESLRRPGGNLTGIQVGGGAAKALEWHLKATPRAKRLLMPVTMERPAQQAAQNLKAGAAKLGIELVTPLVTDLDGLRQVLSNAGKKADGLWVLNSPFLVSNIAVFVDAAKAQHLVLSSCTSSYRVGAMLSYGQDPYHTGLQASRLAEKILQGVKPADIPVEMAEFHLGINLKTARAAGITISEEVLSQADTIIR